MKSLLRFFLGVGPVERLRVRSIGRAHRPCLRRKSANRGAGSAWFAAGRSTLARRAGAASAPREEPKALGRQMRRTHIKVKARFAAPPWLTAAVRAVAPLARMRQAVTGAILICDVGQQRGMTVAASPGIRRGQFGGFRTEGPDRKVRQGEPGP